MIKKPYHRAFLLPLLLFCLLFVVSVETAFSQTCDRVGSEANASVLPSTRQELRAELLKTSDGTLSNGLPTVKRKSPGLAVLASLAIPGLGELYAGRYDVGKFSTIAEVSLWVFYTVLEVHSQQVRSDAVNFAEVNAGVQVTGKPDQFFVNIGNFLNTNDYNVKKIHDGTYDLIYTSPTYQWQWQSDADRAEFKSLRIEADGFLNYGRYTAAVIVLNHLISAINAARLTAGVNASAATSLDNSPRTDGIYLKVTAGI